MGGFTDSGAVFVPGDPPRTGHLADAPGESWRSLDQALRTNQRGLTSGLSLVQLLSVRRGLRVRPYLPPLSVPLAPPPPPR